MTEQMDLAADHREALDAFIVAAQGVPSERWNIARAGEKWSPAQVTEHVRLSYDVARAELSGGAGFKVRTSWWQQLFFRWLIVPRILQRGVFPDGVPAVREIRPGEGPFERPGQLAALRETGEAFEQAIVAQFNGGRGIHHPFLGKLEPRIALRFVSQHLRHHEKQLTD